ncbi:MAG: CBS domain-containing protein [Bacilli bacterium]|nr:CBS domain-containing protein [Bacilli bacterium]
MESIVSLLTPKKLTFYLLETSTIRQALEKFDAHKFSVVPLINEKGEYVGTLSEGDVLRYIKNNANFNIAEAENIKVNQIEHYRPYQSLKIDALMLEVFSLSMEQNFVPIVDDNNIYIGIIKRKEIIRYLGENIDKYLFNK